MVENQIKNILKVNYEEIGEVRLLLYNFLLG